MVLHHLYFSLGRQLAKRTPQCGDFDKQSFVLFLASFEDNIALSFQEAGIIPIACIVVSSKFCCVKGSIKNHLWLYQALSVPWGRQF